jgi:hypothetical protein
MHFFRSEDHLKKWPHYKPETQEGIVPLSDLFKLFSINFFKKRLEPDYFLRVAEYMGDFFPALVQIGKTGPFWIPK